MAEFPRDGEDGTADSFAAEADPVVTCEFQDGTLHVYERGIRIERSSRSKFADKGVPMADIEGVTYSRRLVISYLQIRQTGVDADEESLLSTPVDENTLHFGRGKRGCAKRAAETIRSRMGSAPSR